MLHCEVKAGQGANAQFEVGGLGCFQQQLYQETSIIDLMQWKTRSCEKGGVGQGADCMAGSHGPACAHACTRTVGDGCWSRDWREEMPFSLDLISAASGKYAV